jgi:hypothetical protein
MNPIPEFPFNTLQSQVFSLESQLSEQSKNVDIIKRSNIVTGKNPVRVEITNQKIGDS